MFIVQNKNLFLTDTENYNIGTSQRSYLYLPQVDLTMDQKGAYYLGIKIFNNLLMVIQNVADSLKNLNFL